MPPGCLKRQHPSPTSQRTSQASKKKGRPANSTSQATNSSDNTTRCPPESFLTHQDIPDIVRQAPTAESQFTCHPIISIDRLWAAHHIQP